jgi:polysaccharide export outer membrane protein
MGRNRPRGQTGMIKTLIQRVRGVRRVFAGIGLFALGITTALPQNIPTSEQLQIFQGLSLEQQQAVMEQVAGSRATASSQSPASVPSRNAEQESEERRSAVPVTEVGRVGVLRPEDWVVVELALPGTMSKGSVRAGGVFDPSADTAPRRLRAASDAPIPPDQRKALNDLITFVKLRNPYRLDRNGNLNLPGIAPIQLGGLNEQQAVQRISVESSIVLLDVSLSRLPVDKTGVEALKPFGYELFEQTPSTFSPVTDIPVPADYVIGPGDELRVQLFGGQNRNLPLTVSRDGTVNFPELGPISVGGMRYSAAKATIESRVTQQMIGVRANVAMGETRAIRVFVLGEARQPGSYTVSGLATMTSALFASGGVKPIGSLRDIQLKRQGAIVRRFDLYDLLIKGDTADDAKLQPGDVIFIPPVGPVVSVEGEVKRPAIYELRNETTLESVLQMAGGFTTQADPGRSSLTRIDDQFQRVVVGVDFRTEAGRGQRVRNADALRIARLRPQLDSGVTLQGFVHRPGPLAWRDGLRLTDVIGSIDELQPNADSHYVLVRREVGPDRHVEVLSADLVAALQERGGPEDLLLKPRDQITVFDLAPGRERIIKPLLDELRLQSGLSRPTEVVRVEGRIKVPGEYPLEPGMTISDLLRAGGNLDAAAFGGKAELVRYEITSDGARQTEVIDVDLSSVRAGNLSADVLLRPYDYLLIKEAPDWTDQESVTLTGEVRFPGRYPIRRGETLFEVIQRAGGLTSRAFVRGSAFTRGYLRENERELKESLAERMRSDLASLALQAAAANQSGASQAALAAGQGVLDELNRTQPVGRMVIDLPGLIAAGAGSSKDIALRDGDLLVVPQQRQEVTVIGEVQNPSSRLFSEGFRRDDYIRLSGGMTRKADKGKVYVVRADGSVMVQQGGMLRRSYDLAMQPGDTIVVPLDTERMPKLPFWQAVTQIIYNLAVSVAAVNSF